MESGLCRCGCGQVTSIAKQTETRRGVKKGEHYKYIKHHNGLHKDPQYIEEDRGYETPCWIWQRAIDRNGYSVGSINGRTTTGHRVYYEKANGPIPEGLEIDHKCRTRCCVNPDHLEPVTRHVNHQRGNNAKLNPDAVREIRSRSHAGEPQAKIAEVYGVSQTAVSLVVRGKSWPNIQ